MKRIYLLAALFLISCSKETIVINSGIEGSYTLNSESYASVYEALEITDTEITFYYSNQAPTTYKYEIERIDRLHFNIILIDEGIWGKCHIVDWFLHVDIKDDFQNNNRVVDKRLIFERK